MNVQNDPRLLFKMDPDKYSLFFSILQQGFLVSAMVGCSIKSLLCDQFGVDPEYLSGRISTIFLNGRPVDNVESAIITQGDTLALSGAMPGLVGATFRKGGILSVFRSSITYENDIARIKTPVKGRITLKLFNLIVSEMGPAFLERGFWVTSLALCDFIERKKSNLHTDFNSITMNGHKIEPDALESLKGYDNQQLIHLTLSN